MGLLLMLAALAACDKPAEPAAPASSEKAFQINGKRVALVIGNSKYAHLGELENDKNDADAMAQTLTNLGFVVKEVLDVNAAQMEAEVAQFTQQLQKDSVGLIYYSGHGFELNGNQYLMPVDANNTDVEATVMRENVSIAGIVNQLENKAALSILILDACRNNPLVKALNGKGGSSVKSGGKISAVGGTLIASATSSGDTASPNCGQYSCFTAQLLNHLQTQPDKEARILLGYVGVAVQTATAKDQTPWVASSYGGEFYFAQPIDEEEEVKRKREAEAKRKAEEAAAAATTLAQTETRQAFEPESPPETIYYGSRVGMRVNVLSKQGIDSENAIIKTKHTLENAIEFCREYEHSAQKKCIDEEFSIKINDYISANCQEGNFTDFFGNVYEFQGFKDNHNDPVPLAEYAIYDYKSNEILDGTSASGYPVNLEIFKALCPSRVSKNSNEEDPIPNYSEADRDRILNPK